MKLELSCEQENCKVSIDGKCLEGFEVTKCPHAIIKPNNKTDLQKIAPEIKNKEREKQDTIDVYSGDYLNPTSSIKITSAYLTKVIVLAGANDSGKTTLLANLYDRFQSGPFSGYLFSGSHTLIGFEKRIHLSRINSSGETPDTEHTSLSDEVHLLHLCVRDIKLSKPSTHMLFTDISGERFKLVKDSTDECKKLTILKRADHFVLLIDSKKLACKKERQTTQSVGVAMLRRCIDSGMLGKQTSVDVLFSKWDMVVNLDKEDLKLFIEKIKGQVQKICQGQVKDIRFANISSRKSNSHESYNEVENIFSTWIRESFHSSKEQHDYNDIVFEKEFDKFLRKKQI